MCTEELVFMIKKGMGINVLQAAKDRVSNVFDEFDKIYLSFSAGKDSTVMLHLVMEEAKKRNRKIGLLIVDLEAQYRLTMEHASQCVSMYREYIDLYWVCLPIHLRNAVSVYEPFWMCWDDQAKDAWVRQAPSEAITDHNYFPFFHRGMEFEEFVPLFGAWYAQGEKCACFVGIRCDESLNRFRTIAIQEKQTYKGKRWTTKIINEVYNVYPIYDWKTSDLWLFHARNPDKPYNKLYDMMHRAGVPLGNMRICQPYGDDQRKGLWLFHLIEPETWAKVVARVNGANGGALYCQEWGNVNGYRSVTKPKNHTWKSFAYLLIGSMPPRTKEHYKNRILLFDKWWSERGYPSGIPDEADYEMEQARKAPSWRRVCRSLLRNDYWLKGLGFSQLKSDGYKKYCALMQKRKQEWGVQQDMLGYVRSEPNAGTEA